MNKFIFPTLTLLIFLPIYYFRHNAIKSPVKPGDHVRITGQITSQPIVTGQSQHFQVADITITTPRFPEYQYGQTVQATGIAMQGARKFYLSQPEITVVKTSGFFANLKSKINQLYTKSLPVPESSLVAGVVLGVKSDLPNDFLNSLKNSGTIHVVVASGMNITLFANFLITCMVVLTKRRLALLSAVTGIWLYVLLIGFEPPIIRAAFMSSLTFLAQQTGRITNAWWTLFISGMVMLLIWPQWISDVGFLLSFCATAGILAFEKSISSLVDKARFVPKVIRQDFSVSLAAQIPTSPLLYFFFGRISLFSPFVNAILLWTVAPIMVLGFSGGLIGLLIEPLGKFIILLSYPLAFWFVRIVEMF